MRDRPFISGSESPRPYSEMRMDDPVYRRRLDMRKDIAALEAQGDQDEAEELRDALYHMRAR